MNSPCLRASVVSSLRHFRTGLEARVPVTRRAFRAALPFALAFSLAAPAARAEEPARSCDPRADSKGARLLATDTERALRLLAINGRPAEAEASLRGVVRRAAALPAIRCFPPAEVGLALTLDKQSASRPELASEALALLVGVRRLDPRGLPAAWQRSVSDAGSRADELVRRRLDSGRARLDANDAPGAEAIARGLRQLFAGTETGASAFAAATALLSRALWREGKRAEGRRVGRELEAISLDGLDKASADDVTEALDEHRARPALVVRLHAPPGVALPFELDGEPAEVDTPMRVEPDRDHTLVVDVPGFARIEEKLRVTGPEEVFERTLREALAPAPVGASKDDEAHYAEGISAFDEKRWLDAEAAFDAAKPSTAKSYDLARSAEERGWPVRAWAHFQAVLADKAASPPWLTAHARRHADAVFGALARLRVDLVSTAATVTVDGQRLGPVTAAGESLYAPGAPSGKARLPGTFPLVLERGHHTFRVTQPGFEPWETSVDAAGPGVVMLSLGPKVVSSLRRPLGIAATVVGGVGFVLGAGLGIAAINTIDAAKSDPKLCPNKRCSPAGLDKVSLARSEAWGSTLSFSFGVPLLVTGLVLWAPWRELRKDAPAAPHVAFAPLVGSGLGGLSLGGTFR